MNNQKGASRHHHHPLRASPEPPRGPAIEDASAMFRALGDAARLRLLTRLVAGEICVTELADLEEEKLTTVSARLKTLYAVRLVKRRRQAKHVYYAVADAHVLDLVQSAIKHAAERR
jgi:ArsR family transcriptional regulator, lead/cadmium/zinc/bismuth-responsive transcriptional repressor